MPKTKNGGILFSFALFLAAASWPGSASSQDAMRGKFSGEYYFYSGTVGETALPTKKDAKVGMSIAGPIALHMFQYMGAASAQSSSCVDGEETRLRDGLMCTRDKTTGKAECFFGFDLHSGKSVLGTEC